MQRRSCWVHWALRSEATHHVGHMRHVSGMLIFRHPIHPIPSFDVPTFLFQTSSPVFPASRIIPINQHPPSTDSQTGSPIPSCYLAWCFGIAALSTPSTTLWLRLWRRTLQTSRMTNSWNSLQMHWWSTCYGSTLWTMSRRGRNLTLQVMWPNEKCWISLQSESCAISLCMRPLQDHRMTILFPVTAVKNDFICCKDAWVLTTLQVFVND